MHKRFASAIRSLNFATKKEVLQQTAISDPEHDVSRGMVGLDYTCNFRKFDVPLSLTNIPVQQARGGVSVTEEDTLEGCSP